MACVPAVGTRYRTMGMKTTAHEQAGNGLTNENLGLNTEQARTRLVTHESTSWCGSLSGEHPSQSNMDE